MQVYLSSFIHLPSLKLVKVIDSDFNLCLASYENIWFIFNQFNMAHMQYTPVTATQLPIAITSIGDLRSLSIIL